MSQSPSSDDPAAKLEHDADELEHHLDELDDQISDAQKAADERREDLDPEVVGDWEDTRGTAGQGEDPEGAVEASDAPGGEPGKASDESVGGPTPGHASGGDD